MATPGDLKRFNDTICEIEGITLQCPECGTALKRCEISHEGIPNTHATLPFQYCQTCDTYFVTWREEDEHK